MTMASPDFSARWLIGIAADGKGNRASAVKWICRDGKWTVDSWRNGTVSEIASWLSQAALPAQAGQVAIGLDSAAMRFLRLTLPPAPDDQLPRLAAAQAEARLPIERNQLALACAFERTPSAVAAAAAAARRQLVETALAQWPQAMALAPDGSGLWHLATQVEPELAGDAVIVLARPDGLSVCLFENKRLVDAAFVHTDIAAAATAELQALLDRFGAKEKPLRYVGRFSPQQEEILKGLTSGGWSAAPVDLTALLPPDLATDSRGVCAAGLALAAVSGDILLNFADRWHQTKPMANGWSVWKRWAKPAAISAALALMCALMVEVNYSVRLAAMRRQLAKQKDGMTALQAVEKLQFAALLSRRRPDVLALLSAIQDTRGALLLDALEWEAGKPVRLNALADSYPQVWEFQSRLQQVAGVRNVRLTDAKMDDKNSQVRFTIQFDYSGMVSR